jgi:hypothetical protein
MLAKNAVTMQPWQSENKYRQAIVQVSNKKLTNYNPKDVLRDSLLVASFLTNYSFDLTCQKGYEQPNSGIWL